jgi:NADPH-dependent curcumin reductase CurA
VSISSRAASWWIANATVDGDEARWIDPDLASVSTALGVLGMPGATAYFGTADVADPASGDSVVSAAAGVGESLM